MKLRTVLKPASVPVFPPHADASGDSVWGRVVADEPWRLEVDWPDGFAGGIAHRWDTATSGAVVVAADLGSLSELRGWFEAHRLIKTYIFEARNVVPWRENVVTASLAHDPRRADRMVVQRGADTPHRGRWYAAETSIQRRSARLWTAKMSTGVMHQIRVHAAFVGLALRGDQRYGGGPPIDPVVPFHLHHVGLAGPGGLSSDPVALPHWAEG